MEHVFCENCGIEIPKSDAFYYEDGDYYVCQDCKNERFVECERCGALIPYEEAYRGNCDYLCEYCHDDLYA